MPSRQFGCYRSEYSLFRVQDKTLCRAAGQPAVPVAPARTYRVHFSTEIQFMAGLGKLSKMRTFTIFEDIVTRP